MDREISIVCYPFQMRVYNSDTTWHETKNRSDVTYCKAFDWLRRSIGGLEPLYL